MIVVFKKWPTYVLSSINCCVSCFLFTHVELLIHSRTSLISFEKQWSLHDILLFPPNQNMIHTFFHTWYCPIIATLHSDGGIYFPQPLFGVYFICRLEWTPVDYCAQEAVKSLLRPWTTKITSVCPFNKCHQGQTSLMNTEEKPPLYTRPLKHTVKPVHFILLSFLKLTVKFISSLSHFLIPAILKIVYLSVSFFIKVISTPFSHTFLHSHFL